MNETKDVNSLEVIRLAAIKVAMMNKQEITDIIKTLDLLGIGNTFLPVIIGEISIRIMHQILCAMIDVGKMVANTGCIGDGDFDNKTGLELILSNVSKVVSEEVMRSTGRNISIKFTEVK